MANNNTSPEERLFKIIREEKAPASDTVSGSKKKDNAVSRWLSDISGYFQRSNFFGLAKGAGHKRLGISFKLSDLDPRIINGVLVVALVGMSAVVAYSLFNNNRHGIDRIMKNVSAVANSVSAARLGAVEPLKDVSFYLNEIRKNDIFHIVRDEAGKVVSTTLDPSGELKKKLADFKIQGITWGRVSRAMIYNSKDNKMYILKQADMIGGTGIKVKTIMQNKIVVTSGDMESEIT